MHGPVGVPTYIFIALLTDQVSQVLTTVGCGMRTDSSSGVIVGMTKGENLVVSYRTKSVLRFFYVKIDPCRYLRGTETFP